MTLTKAKTCFEKNISTPVKCSMNSRHSFGFKNSNQFPRYSINNKNISYSPLQEYGRYGGYDFKSSEYCESYESSQCVKNSLPNDSWHYQIQVQKTLKDDYNEKDRTIELDLSTFKTEKCSIEAKHNPKHCKFYHSLKDRRRGHMNYSTDLCRFAETDKCLRGDKCFLSHSNVERLYHPDKYKTKF
jgi:hypothetical protein